METQTLTPILTLFDTPFNLRIAPLGIINDELFFFGFLDLEIGLELYKVPLGITSNTREEHLTVIDLQKTKSQLFIIKSSLPDKF